MYQSQEYPLNFLSKLTVNQKTHFLLCISAVLKREFMLTIFVSYVIKSKKKKERQEFIMVFLMNFAWP